MSLYEIEIGKEAVIQDVVTGDEEMKSFLFTLGCFSGESITVVNRKKNNLVVAIKDARYNMDSELAEAIII